MAHETPVVSMTIQRLAREAVALAYHFGFGQSFARMAMPASADLLIKDLPNIEVLASSGFWE